MNLGSPSPFLFAVPIAVKDDLYGVMLIEEAPGGLRFRARRLEIITGIAQQAALAIQNDLLQKEMVVRERLETEVQLARQIQQTFIPESLPQFDEWSLPRAGRRLARWAAISTMFSICRTGDWDSSSPMSPIKVSLPRCSWRSRGLSSRGCDRAGIPADAMKRANDLLIPDTKQGMFVTAVYAVLDMEKNELTYVNAGHNLPLWIKCDGGVQRLTRIQASPSARRKM